MIADNLLEAVRNRAVGMYWIPESDYTSSFMAVGWVADTPSFGDRAHHKYVQNLLADIASKLTEAARSRRAA